MIDLTGKTALVTGASRGIGRACALRLAEAGADIVINYATNKTQALETAERVCDLGRRAVVVKADVSEADDVADMLELVDQEFGQLDILVSNAASGGFRNLLDLNTRQFQAAMGINVLALVHLAQRAAPLLERASGRGKIVVLSSHGADLAMPMYGLIGSSKAALESMARHLTLELGSRGVNVNIVRAGLVETDSTRSLPGSERMFAGRTDNAMVGQRVLEASDVANAVLFLASPLADLVQGATLTVDGGAEIHV
jgi:enoyl-[acyl-carrier protein] reductase III